MFIVSWRVQFFSNLGKHRSPVSNLIVSHGEQTLVEKDSPSSRTTKSSFFSIAAHFGNVSPFLVGATNTFSELIHPLIKLPNCVLKSTIYPKPSAHSAYSPFEQQAQALLAYCHFYPFLILHFIYYISQRSNANARFFLSPHTPYGRVRLARFALKTVTQRFTDFFTDFEEKIDCFAVHWKEHFSHFLSEKDV